MRADSPSLSMRAAPSLFILGWIAAITGYFSVIPEDIAGLLAILAWTAAFILILMFSGLEACSEPEKKVEIKSTIDSVAYGIGMSIAKQNKDLDIEMDIDVLRKGYLDAISKDTTVKTMITMEDYQKANQNFMMVVQEKQQQKQTQEAAENKTKGLEFLKANATKDGVQITTTGLQYKVIKMGEGPKPQATSTVKVHYTGTLIDGTKFDSSVDRGEPVEFPLNRVIPGWTEGLQLMPVGSKFMFYIPAEIGYGDRGNASIPGGSTLIFEVELLDIVQ